MGAEGKEPGADAAEATEGTETMEVEEVPVEEAAEEAPAEEAAEEETAAEEPETAEETETVEPEAAEEPEAEEAEAAAEEQAEDAGGMKTEIDFSEELSEFENLFKKEGFDFSDIAPLEEADAAAGKAPVEETAAETATEEAPQPGAPAEDVKSFIKNYNTGRSGHEYSKEELEDQIRI